MKKREELGLTDSTVDGRASCRCIVSGGGVRHRRIGHHEHKETSHKSCHGHGEDQTKEDDAEFFIVEGLGGVFVAQCYTRCSPRDAVGGRDSTVQKNGSSQFVKQLVNMVHDVLNSVLLNFSARF